MPDASKEPDAAPWLGERSAPAPAASCGNAADPPARLRQRSPGAGRWHELSSRRSLTLPGGGGDLKDGACVPTSRHQWLVGPSTASAVARVRAGLGPASPPLSLPQRGKRDRNSRPALS